MRLINKNKGTPFADVGAYVCELTDELDALAKTVSDASVNRHYILADEFCKRNKCLAIRIQAALWAEYITTTTILLQGSKLIQTA